ncbi:MAG: iron transporter [Epsilonproteobacteria bacterium]|jgi:Fe2+ transport system protein FeoA|nr:iron transporter [Campylobacterota bacterium]NPA89091.1 ferrous iron transport protein A [Campylobacterota bacterium]
MRLNQLNIGDEGIIRKIYAKSPLRERLMAFGFAKGEKVKVVKHTLRKNTFDIEIGNVNVALRGEEAEQIEVEPLIDGELPGKNPVKSEGRVS